MKEKRFLSTAFCPPSVHSVIHFQFQLFLTVFGPHPYVSYLNLPSRLPFLNFIYETSHSDQICSIISAISFLFRLEGTFNCDMREARTFRRFPSSFHDFLSLSAISFLSPRFPSQSNGGPRLATAGRRTELQPSLADRQCQVQDLKILVTDSS